MPRTLTRRAYLTAFDSVEPDPYERAAECPERRRARLTPNAFPFPGDVSAVAATGCLPRTLGGRPRVVFDYIAAGM